MGKYKKKHPTGDGRVLVSGWLVSFGKQVSSGSGQIVGAQMLEDGVGEHELAEAVLKGAALVSVERVDGHHPVAREDAVALHLARAVVLLEELEVLDYGTQIVHVVLDYGL